MFFSTPNSVKIFYEQTGQGEDLILISGLTCDHTIWEGVIPALSSHFRILRLDNRGAGQSDTPKDFSIEAMANDVIALMDHLNIKSAYVAGHSMGGAILQQLLIQAPERIKKAVICASFARLPLLARIHIRTSYHLMKANVDIPKVAETVIPWIFGRTFVGSQKNVPAIVEVMTSSPWPQTPAGYLGQATALEKLNLRGKLNNIRVKTLVIAGGKDILTPPACSRYIQRSIPNAEYAVLKKSGHMLQVEYPEELAKLIMGFCTK